MHEVTRLEWCTLWSKIKFQRCSSCHITGNDISMATKEINSTVASKEKMVCKVTVAAKSSKVTPVRRL
jgi:hypothetical protein